MKKIIVKLRDNTEIEICKKYEYAADINSNLNDCRDKFIQIGDYIFAKDIIASVSVEEIEETEDADSN